MDNLPAVCSSIFTVSDGLLASVIEFSTLTVTKHVDCVGEISTRSRRDVMFPCHAARRSSTPGFLETRRKVEGQDVRPGSWTYRIHSE